MSTLTIPPPPSPFTHYEEHDYRVRPNAEGKSVSHRVREVLNSDDIKCLRKNCTEMLHSGGWGYNEHGDTQYLSGNYYLREGFCSSKCQGIVERVKSNAKDHNGGIAPEHPWTKLLQRNGFVLVNGYKKNRSWSYPKNGAQIHFTTARREKPDAASLPSYDRHVNAPVVTVCAHVRDTNGSPHNTIRTKFECVGTFDYDPKDMNPSDNSPLVDAIRIAQSAVSADFLKGQIANETAPRATEIAALNALKNALEDGIGKQLAELTLQKDAVLRAYNHVAIIGLSASIRHLHAELEAVEERLNNNLSPSDSPVYYVVPEDQLALVVPSYESRNRQSKLTDKSK